MLIKTGRADFQAIIVIPTDDSKKLTIINIYDSPEQSSYKAKRKIKTSVVTTKITTLEQLFEIRTRNLTLCEVLLAGDLNAGTGSFNYGPEKEVILVEPEKIPASYLQAQNH